MVETRDTLITFKGLPQPAKNFRTDGRGYVRLPSDGSLVMSVILEWGVVAYKSVDGGYAWNYLSTILLGTDVPHSEEGPNENDLALMADGSIICIIRLDGGDGRCASDSQAILVSMQISVGDYSPANHWN